MEKTMKLFLLLLLSAGLFPARTQDNLTLDSALQLTIRKNPALQSLRKRIASREQLVVQANARPNPEAEVELENFGRNEFEAAVTLPIELGGKRKARTAQAKKEVTRSGLELDAGIIEIETEVIATFLPIAALNNRIEILDSIIAVAESMHETIMRQVSFGARNRIDAMRTEIRLEALRLEKEMITREKDRFSAHLPVLWADTSGVIPVIADKLLDTSRIPALASFLDSVETHPEVRLQFLEQELLSADISVIKTEAKPDLGIRGGYLRNNERGENAVILGVSIDLPLFNRNTALIKSREIDASVLDQDFRSFLMRRKKRIRQLYDECTGVTLRIERMKTSMLPRIHAVLDTISDYYLRGSTDILDVMEVHREYLELYDTVNELMRQRAGILTELYSLTGLYNKLTNQTTEDGSEHE